MLDSSKECKKCVGQGTKALILRRLLIGLSKKAQLLPDSLFVEGVICNDKNSVACGGYADVYRAVYCGREVALKRMRVFSSDSSEKEMKSVSLCVLDLSLLSSHRQ